MNKIDIFFYKILLGIMIVSLFSFLTTKVPKLLSIIAFLIIGYIVGDKIYKLVKSYCDKLERNE